MFLNRAGCEPPTCEVRILELHVKSSVDGCGRFRVRRSDYREPKGYAERFGVLLEAGLPWINVSCCGVDQGNLIVVVELPREEARVHTSRTSINYSGPTRDVLEHNWDASVALAIE
jgi:hypothetical protein